MKKRFFGTDGIRGKANVYPIDPKTMLKIGKGIGLYLRKKNKKTKVLIGKDTRKSGYILEQALSTGLCSSGVDTYFLGPIPTPGVAYLVKYYKADLGIVVSASHNSFEDNGIKFFNAFSEKLSKKEELDLESFILSELDTNSPLVGEDIGSCFRLEDANALYGNGLKSYFQEDSPLKGFKVVLDSAHGAAYKIGPELYRNLGADLVSIGDKPNGLNINHEVGSLYPEKLSKAILSEAAQVGFALDGDADRLIVVDDKGFVLDGDDILALLTEFLFIDSSSPVVGTSMTNEALARFIKLQGKPFFRAQVGDRDVAELMKANESLFGGEPSGHILYAKHLLTSDALFTSLLIMKILSQEKKNLSELRKSFKKDPQILKSFSVSKKVSLENLPELMRMMEEGKKKLGTGARVVFRYSGTENKARIMVEGLSYDKVSMICDELVECAEKEIEAQAKKENCS